MLKTTLAAGAVLAAVGFACARFAIPIGLISRDPASTFSAPFYVGLLSNLGVVLWTATAAICLFGAQLLARRSTAARSDAAHSDDARPEQSRFLLGAGSLTALLGADDLLLLHEDVFPLRLGIPEGVVLAMYGLLALWFLVRFRKLLAGSDLVLLLIAGGFGAMSVGIDLLPFTIPLEFTVEESSKFLAVSFWFAYFWRTAQAFVLAEHVEVPATATSDLRAEGRAARQPARVVTRVAH